MTIFAPGALDYAVDDLLTVEGSLDLKVDCGEHLAAIALTAQCGLPTSVDRAGEVDVMFDAASMPSKEWHFGEHTRAAVEIKSLPGRFRKIHRHISEGSEVQTVFRSAIDILEDAAESINKAVCQLHKKAPGPEWSRNVFLIIHLFDGLAVELFDESQLLGHLLPELAPSVELDRLWLLWHPDHLAMWSQAERDWTIVMEAGYDYMDIRSFVPDEDEVSPFMRAEQRYLRATGQAGASPWAFKFVEGTEGGMSAEFY